MIPDMRRRTEAARIEHLAATISRHLTGYRAASNQSLVRTVNTALYNERLN